MQEELSVTLGDLWALFRRRRGFVLKWALIVASLSLVYALTRPLTYQVEATFRDRGKNQPGADPSQMMMVMMGGSSSENEASTSLKTYRVLKPVVQRFGLQVKVTPSNTSSRLMAPFYHILSEVAHFRLVEEPIFSTKPTLQLRDVFYTEEKTLNLTLEFKDKDHFVLSNGETGRVGEPYSNETLSFTLYNEGVDITKTYSLHFSPLTPTVERLIKQLKVEVDKKDKTLVKLKWSHTDRLLAPKILNEVMYSYQNFLAGEAERLSTAQIAYLEKREKESFNQLENILLEHAHLVSNDLSTLGFYDTEKALHFFAGTQEEMQRKIVAAEVERQRIEEIRKDFDILVQGSFIPGISEIVHKVAELKQKQDLIALNLKKERAYASLAPPIASQEEYQGMDFVTSCELLVRYFAEKEELESQCLQYGYLINQVADPQFEMSALSSIVKDPVGQEIANRAMNLEILLRDPDNRSQKEQERLQNELTLRKNFLKIHLEQTKDLITLRLDLLKEKIRSLQINSLGAIDTQLTTLEKQAKDLLEARAKSLLQEKEFYTSEMKRMGERMTLFPEKWVSEQLMKQQMAGGQQLVNEVRRLVENKNIQANLDVIHSAPVELAYAPTLPNAPMIPFFGLLGLFVGTFGACTYLLTEVVRKGIVATKENLALAGQSATDCLSGNVEPLTDPDLKILRTIVTFIEKKSALFVLGEGPDYTDHIVKLMQERGEKVLKIELDFSAPSEKKGLYAYLMGQIEEVPIYNHKVIFGGISRNGVELVQRSQFYTWLNEVSPSYDRILITCKEMFTSHFDHYIMQIHEETLQELQPLFKMHPLFVYF